MRTQVLGYPRNDNRSVNFKAICLSISSNYVFTCTRSTSINIILYLKSPCYEKDMPKMFE